jgi:hypothetical protein
MQNTEKVTQRVPECRGVPGSDLRLDSRLQGDATLQHESDRLRPQ